jgi:hypothetical protein
MNCTFSRKYLLQIALGFQRYRKGATMFESLNNKIA